MSKTKPIRMAIIKKAWIETYALEGLIKAVELGGPKQGAEVVITSPSDYSLPDGHFAELTFGGKLRRMLIPKDQIVTLFEMETKQDAEIIGFKLP